MRSQNRKVNNVGKAGCLGLLAIGWALVNPMSCLSVFAEDGDADEVSVSATQSSVPSSVQISFDEPVGVSSLTPIDTDGASALYSVKATVDVANSGGYTVYLGSSKAELTGKNSGATINGVTSSTNYEGMPVNSWGYSYAEGETAGTTFSAMPANIRGVTLGGNNSTNIKNDSKTFTISFAAHIGNDKPVDTYENEVTMSVVSSPLEITNAFGIEYMQDMTAKICNDITTPVAFTESGEINTDVPTTQLIDKRDGKKYWVAKLADGNCWMTQNLDLDIPNGGFTFNSTTVGMANSYVLSDMSSTTNGTTGITNGTTAWNNPTAATATTISMSTASSASTASRSWDQGLYVYTNPESTTTCTGGSSSTQGLGYKNCSSTFIKVDSSWTASDQVDFTTINGSPIDSTNKIYDTHYLVGNWYQWNAATAGSGGSIKSSAVTEAGMVNAASSICPAGWRLPISGGIDTYRPFNQAKSFGALLRAYGGNGTSSVAQNNIQTNTLTKSPYFFVRSGIVYSSGYLDESGYGSYYWSSTAGIAASDAYPFAFYTGNAVYPSRESWGRASGLSVRCVAR